MHAAAPAGSDEDMLPPDLPCVGLFSLLRQDMGDILNSVSAAVDPPVVGARTAGEEDQREEDREAEEQPLTAGLEADDGGAVGGSGVGGSDGGIVGPSRELFDCSTRTRS